MLLALPEGTPEGIYYHGVNMWMHVASICLFVAFGIALIAKRKDDNEILRKIKQGYGLFLLFYATCRVFFILATWYHSAPWHENSYDFLVVFGYFTAAIGMACIIFVIEKYLVTKTRFIFTILALIMIVIYILSIAGIFSQAIALTLSWISSPFLIAIIVVLYLSLAIRSTGKLRRNSIIILLAIMLIAVSTVLDGESVITSVPAWFDNDLVLMEIFYSIPHVISMAGVAVFFKVTY